MTGFASTVLFLLLLPVPSPASPVELGDVRPICVLTGEVDRATGQATVNKTESRYGFRGTDLGASFRHEDALIFTFGDTFAAAGVPRPNDVDLVAVSRDRDPEDCVNLGFPRDPADRHFVPLDVKAEDRSGRSLSTGLFEVPTGGFSANGAMYIIKTTDNSREKAMGRSVLAKAASRAPGETLLQQIAKPWQALFSISTDKFINVAPVVPSVAANPLGRPAVFYWASGLYRASSPYFAYSPLESVEAKSEIRYFAGLNSLGAPLWSRLEREARPLFDHPCIGELSVAWLEGLKRWVMLYNCVEPASPAGSVPRVYARFSPEPWGPWSDKLTVFDGWENGGYCRFMYDKGELSGRSGCVTSKDPWDQNRGEAYGPYLIDAYTRSVRAGESTVYFVLSTWNPYNTVVMRATFRVAD